MKSSFGAIEEIFVVGVKKVIIDGYTFRKLSTKNGVKIKAFCNLKWLRTRFRERLAKPHLNSAGPKSLARWIPP